MLIPAPLAETDTLPGWVVPELPVLCDRLELDRPLPPEAAWPRAGRPSAAQQAHSTATRWALGRVTFNPALLWVPVPTG